MRKQIKIQEYILITLIALISSFFVMSYVIKLFILKDTQFKVFDFLIIFIHGDITLVVLATIIGFTPALYLLIESFFNRVESRMTGDSDAFNELMETSHAKEIFLMLPFDENGIKYKPHELKKLEKKGNYYMIGNESLPYRAGIPLVAKRGTFLEKRDLVWVDPTQSHTIIIGTTNCGKTVTAILPLINMIKMCGESGVIIDLKGELSAMTYEGFVERGYKVYILDFINPDTSDGWNPLFKAYEYWQEENERIKKKKRRLEILKSEVIERYIITHNIPTKEINIEEISERINFDIELGFDENGNPNSINGEIQVYPDYSKAQEIVEIVANAICKDSVPKPNEWNDMAADVLKGMIYLALEENDKDKVNLSSIKNCLDIGNTICKTDNAGNKISYLKEYVTKKRKETDLSSSYLNSYLNAAENTATSIMTTLNPLISKFILSQQVKNLLASNEIDLNSIDNQKTIIYLKVHDDQNTYYPLVNIFMTQLQQTLIEIARNNQKQGTTSTEKLRYPFNFVWDEFATFPKYDPIRGLLAAARSREIRLFLVIQGFNQLKDKYGDATTKSILENCMNKFYLLSDDPETLDYFSKGGGRKRTKKNDKDTEEPIFTVERLSRFKYGEVLLLRQREMPFFTNLPHNKQYKYYKKENHIFEIKKRKQAPIWDLKGENIKLWKEKE